MKITGLSLLTLAPSPIDFGCAMGKRHYFGKKEEADQLRSVDIYDLKRDHCLSDLYKGTITWRNSDNEETSSIGFSVQDEGDQKYIDFNYSVCGSQTEQRQLLQYRVELTTTPCYFGGQRYYFLCPLNPRGLFCNRRVAKLYLAGNYFGCRHCYQLTYHSRNARRRGLYGWLEQECTLTEKMERLEKSMRTRYWMGQTTRRYRQYLGYQAAFRRLTGTNVH